MSDMEDNVDIPEEEVCLACQKQFTKSDKCVQCFLCELWSHVKCAGLSADCMKVLASKKFDGMNWTCKSCKSFAAKYSKASLKVDARLDKLEEESAKINELIIDVDELRKKLESDTTGTGGDADAIFEELREREMKKDNILVYGIPEPHGNTSEQRAQMDKNRICEVLRKIDTRAGLRDIKFLVRLGKYDNDKCRPILVGLRSAEVRDEILSKASRLNTLDKPFSLVKITKDLTKRQRDEDYRLISVSDKRNETLTEEEKKNFVWKVIGKRGERRLIKTRLPQDGPGQRGEDGDLGQAGPQVVQPPMGDSRPEGGNSGRYDALGARPRTRIEHGDRESRSGSPGAHRNPESGAGWWDRESRSGAPGAHRQPEGADGLWDQESRSGPPGAHRPSFGSRNAGWVMDGDGRHAPPPQYNLRRGRVEGSSRTWRSF